MSIKELTAAQMDAEVLGASTPVVVDFWSPFCAPCKAMLPSLEAIGSELSNIKIVKVDVSKEHNVAQRFGVAGLPTIVFFNHGKEVGRFTGMLPKPALQRKIKQAFS